jgi:hypothetical protein
LPFEWRGEREEKFKEVVTVIEVGSSGFGFDDNWNFVVNEMKMSLGENEVEDEGEKRR